MWPSEPDPTLPRPATAGSVPSGQRRRARYWRSPEGMDKRTGWALDPSGGSNGPEVRAPSWEVEDIAGGVGRLHIGTWDVLDAAAERGPGPEQA